jgi:hypothetical protein
MRSGPRAARAVRRTWCPLLSTRQREGALPGSIKDRHHARGGIRRGARTLRAMATSSEGDAPRIKHRGSDADQPARGWPQGILRITNGPDHS